MASARIRWTRLALEDLAAAQAHLANESPAGWAKLSSQVRSALEKLRKNPRLGKFVPEREAQAYREMQLPPYRLVYAIAGSELHILRFRHARRDPASL